MADFEIRQRIYIKWCFQLIERLADLERQLSEAKKLAEWTPITLENLPKVGDEMCTYVAGEWIVSAVRHDHSVAHYLACGASHFRSIAPPQSEKTSTTA